MKKVFENFGTYLSVLTFVVLCVGFLNLKVYYSNFNIDIEDYITASEIIILSIPTLFKILTYLLFPALILMILIKDFDNYKAKNLPLNKWMTQKKIAYPSLISLFVCVFLGSLKFFILPDNLRDIIVELFNFMGPITLAILFSIGFVTGKLGVDPTVFKIGYGAMILMGLFMAFYIPNRKKLLRLERGKGSEYLIFFNKKDTLLKTNDSVSLIGRTDKYFFIFNNKSFATTVISSSEVTSMIIDKNLLNGNSTSIVGTNRSQRNPEYNSCCSIICIIGKLLNIYGFIELKTFLLLCPKKEIIGNQ